MSVQQMKPDEIYTVFMSRISKTNLLYDTLSDDSSIELSNTIYFKYYFDVSTAIEAVIRGITFEESKIHSYIKYLSEPASDKKSFFVPYDELKALIKLDEIYNNADKEFFIKEYCKKISVLKTYLITKDFKNIATFNDCYLQARKTRNILAHGIMSSNTVEFNQHTLESFLYVLYILINYYKDLVTKYEE